ncbi:MAG: hypothetical protein AAB871_02960 [Patescibacteria group bacterium]
MTDIKIIEQPAAETEPSRFEAEDRKPETGKVFDEAAQMEALTFGLVIGEIELSGHRYKVGVKGPNGELPSDVDASRIQNLTDTDREHFKEHFALPPSLNSLDAWKLPVIESGNAEILKEPPVYSSEPNPKELPAYIPQTPETGPVAVNNLASIATNREGSPLERLKKVIASGGTSGSMDQIAAEAARVHAESRENK